MEWLGRIADAGARFKTGDAVSTLKIDLHYKPQLCIPQYEQQEEWLHLLDRYMRLPVHQIRDEIAFDLAEAVRRGLMVRPGTSGELKFTEQEQCRITAFYFIGRRA